MLRTDIKGLSVAYERAGRGPAVVLLHGFTQDSRAWLPQLADLSDRFTVIAWDAPGAGQSSDPPDGFAMADWADTLAALLDAEAIAHAHIVGLSWGGVLAQELYGRYPSRVSSLVLADTTAGWAGSFGEPAAKQKLAACIRDSSLPAGEMVKLYLPGMFSDDPLPEIRDRLAEIMSDTHPTGFRLMATALAEGDTRDLLPRIKAPTLLVWGDADRRTPISFAHQLVLAIPGARLVVLPGVGHVSNLEAPAAFTAILREFLLAQSGF